MIAVITGASDIVLVPLERVVIAIFIIKGVDGS
jgi:hypothetical protein